LSGVGFGGEEEMWVEKKVWVEELWIERKGV